MSMFIKSFSKLQEALVVGSQNYLNQRSGEAWIFRFFSIFTTDGIARARQLNFLAQQCDPETLQGKIDLLALTSAVFMTSSKVLVEVISELLIDGYYSVNCPSLFATPQDKHTLKSTALSDKALNAAITDTNNLYCSHRGRHRVRVTLIKHNGVRTALNEATIELEQWLKSKQMSTLDYAAQVARFKDALDNPSTDIPMIDISAVTASSSK